MISMRYSIYVSYPTVSGENFMSVTKFSRIVGHTEFLGARIKEVTQIFFAEQCKLEDWHLEEWVHQVSSEN